MTYDDYIEACGLEVSLHQSVDGAREAWIHDCDSREAEGLEPRSMAEFLAGVEKPELPLPAVVATCGDDDIPF